MKSISNVNRKSKYHFYRARGNTLKKIETSGTELNLTKVAETPQEKKIRELERLLGELKRENKYQTSLLTAIQTVKSTKKSTENENLTNAEKIDKINEMSEEKRNMRYAKELRDQRDKLLIKVRPRMFNDVNNSRVT